MLGLLFKFLGGGVAKKIVKGGVQIWRDKLANEKSIEEYDAEHDIETLKASQGSWKDEFLVILFTLPLWTIFFGELITGCKSLFVDKDFHAIEQAGHSMIDQFLHIDGEYAAILMTIVIAVFGRGAYKMHQGHKAKKRIGERIKDKVEDQIGRP